MQLPPDELVRSIREDLEQVDRLMAEIRVKLALIEEGATAQPIPARSLLTVAEAAEQLHLGQSTVKNLIRQGRLRSIKVGGARRIPVDAISELAAGSGAATPPARGV
jgi:excisionase family DNA binding protein